MPKVSVVIPTHNRAAYLAEAIDSVLGQTYQDFEIVVIDDGSNDNTNMMMRNYTDKYPDKIKYLFQEQKGISTAKNNGIRNSRGELIAFLDSDDRWLPEKLEKQIKLIKDTNVGFVHSNAHAENKEGVTSRIKPSSPALSFYDLFIRGKNIITSTALIRKEYLEMAGLLDENLQIAVDYDLWLRLLLFYEIKHINEPLVIYREHENNISNDSEKMLKSGIEICKKFLKIDKIPQIIVKKKLSLKYYTLGKLYYDNKKFKEAANEIGHAIAIYPLVGINFITDYRDFIVVPILIIKPYVVFLYLIIMGFLWRR